MHPQQPAVFLPCYAYGIVKVPRVLAVHGKHRFAAKVAPPVAYGRMRRCFLGLCRNLRRKCVAQPLFAYYAQHIHALIAGIAQHLVYLSLQRAA